MSRLREPYGLHVVDSCQHCSSHCSGLFCNLPAPSFSQLATIRQTALYPRGALLFVEDEPPRGLFVVCTGQVRLSASSERGKRITLRLAGPGEALGLSSLISNRPFELIAETLVPSQVCFFPQLELLRFLRGHPEVAMRIAEHLSAELHEAWQHMRLLSLSPCCRARLARFLLLRARDSSTATAQGLRIPLHMTEAEIGEAIGATRETVSRLLNEMKRRHLIQLRGGSVVLLKPDELRALSPG